MIVNAPIKSHPQWVHNHLRNTYALNFSQQVIRIKKNWICFPLQPLGTTQKLSRVFRPFQLQPWWRQTDPAGPRGLWRRPRLHIAYSSWRPGFRWLTAALSLGSAHCTGYLNLNKWVDHKLVTKKFWQLSHVLFSRLHRFDCCLFGCHYLTPKPLPEAKKGNEFNGSWWLLTFFRDVQ